jgi:hypothetical protein
MMRGMRRGAGGTASGAPASAQPALRLAGLGLAAAALLLDAGVLLYWLGPFGLRESFDLTLAAAALRIAIFGAGLALLGPRGSRPAAFPRRPFAACAAWYLGFLAAGEAFSRTTGAAELLAAAAASARGSRCRPRAGRFSASRG